MRVHAGIELEVDVQDVIRAGEGRFQRLSVFERVYLLRDVHKDHAVGIFGRRIAEVRIGVRMPARRI